MNTGGRKRTIYILQVLFSIVCLGWVAAALAKTDWAAVGELLENISPEMLISALTVFTFLYASRLLRLRYWIHSATEKRLPWRSWIGLYLAATALGSVTPGRLGDAAKIPLLLRTGLPLATRGKVYLLEKAMDLAYLPAGLCLTASVVSVNLHVPERSLLYAGVLGLFLGIVVVSYFGRSFGQGALAVGWFFTTAGFFLYVIANFLLFRSLGITLTLPDVAAVTITVGVIAALPVSLGGLGVRELSFITVLGIWGVSRETAAPVLILEFFVNMVFPGLLYGLWHLFKLFGKRY